MLDNEKIQKNNILKRLRIKAPTFYKDIQKLRESGFDVTRESGFYYIKRYKKVLELSNAEKSTIAYMINTALEFLPKYKFENFKNFLDKFLILTTEKDYNEIIKKYQLIKRCSLIEQYEEKIKELELYILKKKNAKITLRSNRKILIRPLRFDWKKDKPMVYYMDISKNIEDKINIENIAKIESESKKDYIIQEDEVIFELYGTLAKRYLLKKEERIVKNTKDSLVIATNTKDKKMLFKRLLRYDTLCKILFPHSEVNNFTGMIDKAIINID